MKMNKIILIVIVLFMFGCNGNQQMNTLGGGLLGGIAGGIAGNQIGSGSGRTAAIIGGTIAGVALGSYIGSYMDRSDQQQVNRTLETMPSNRPVSWQNPDSGHQYQMVAQPAFQTNQGTYCREFLTEAYIHNQVEQMYGMACRQPDGSWKVQ